MSIFGGGSSGGSAPSPPPFQPINIPQIEDQAYNADVLGYNLSDADLADRFPGLVSARNQQTQNAYNELTGPLNPKVQNSFVTQGLGQAFGAFGGGNPNAGIGTDTASGKAVATSLANNVQRKQDYDRQYFEQTLANNPQRQFGLNGSDVLNLMLANTQGQNSYNQQRYAAQYGNYNAQNAAAGQSSSALLGILSSLASAAIIASDKRLKKDIKDTGAKTKDDIPIKTFKYKGKNKKHVGVVAQDAQKKRPDAVLTDPRSGIKSVDYAKLLFGGRK